METPKFYQPNCFDAKTNDHFIIDDLLDFPNDDDVGAAEGGAAFGDNTSCNSSLSTSAAPAAAETYFQAADIGGPRSFVDGHISNELCVPYDDLAELEWVSSFVDESFSSEDLQKLQLIQGIKARTNEIPRAHQYQFQPETNNPGPIPDRSVPAKARSKRSRAAPGRNWTSRLLTASPTPSPDAPAMSSSSETSKKEAVGVESSADGRRCLHCATDKTPQWRTGPLGPKTLCNACGVRFKSGRLVPEYRPAASPTFVLTKHSNSHRKVLELRRQKEMVRSQQLLHHHHQTAMVFDASNFDDYLIHQHIGPDFRQLIHD